MRYLAFIVPAFAGFAALTALAPASAQAADAAARAVSSVRDANVQTVAEGCGPYHHRVWRHGRSWCVHN
ncbi:MAG: hypothetical protein JOZ05_04290 [Acetobacteraceae bacterium]|nr:hypothetical protein [Acetobacteraceae bacterium]